MSLKLERFEQLAQIIIINIPLNLTTPTVPNSLTATGGTNQITLNWLAPTNNGGTNITGYKIYRGATAGSEVYLTTTSNVLTYANTGLAANTYYYKVTAINSIGEGGYSNEANATANPITGSQTYTYTGTIANFTVPTGVTSITITAAGAQGGQYTSTTGGLGASVKGTFAVTPGQILSILVGQWPSTTSSFPAGGGGTFVALGASYATATPMIVAGGGGATYTGGAGQAGQITVNGGGGTYPQGLMDMEQVRHHVAAVAADSTVPVAMTLITLQLV